MIKITKPQSPRTQVTHGYRRRIAPVLLACTNRYRLRPTTTTGSVPGAPGHTLIGAS